jgi:hypothetical protein
MLIEQFLFLGSVSTPVMIGGTHPDTNLCTDDDVRSQTEEEEILYKVLSEITQQPAALLFSRWAAPSLTIHNLESTGPKSQLTEIQWSTEMLTALVRRNRYSRCCQGTAILAHRP